MSVFEWGEQLNSLVNEQVDAQVAGEEIERVKAKNGGKLSARKLWESQKGKRSKLHGCFEWDNEVAGAKYRDRQAGEVIRSIKVVLEDDSVEGKSVRAFSSIRDPESPRKSVYVNTVEAMKEEDLQYEILSNALAGLISWRKRWVELNECADMVAEVDEVIEKARKDISKWKVEAA